jgi:hypothetical protein
MSEKKEIKKVEEVDCDEETNKTQLRANEPDILKGLLEAASFKTEEDNIKNIEVARGGKLLFSFHIHPLTEEEYDKCRESNTKYVRNKQLGIKFPENTDTVRYRSELLFMATVDEDRAKIWNNKQAWEKLNVITGIDMVDKVLLAGEKDAILEILDKISGYKTTEEETAKN